MEKIIRTTTRAVKFISEGSEVLLKGWVHEYRKLSKMAFIVLRAHDSGSPEYVQIFVPKDIIPLVLHDESVIEVTGIIKKEPQSKYGGVEVVASNINILAQSEVLPFSINPKEDIPFSTKYNYRPLTIRGDREIAIFKIQAGICEGFRKFLNLRSFTEIQSTKLSKAGLEGGGELFNVPYFDTELYLTQSPQFYKQMMIGSFEKVYEIGKVYRAEGSKSNRHLTEFIGLDVEIGFIDSSYDVIRTQETLIGGIFNHLREFYKEPLKVLGINPHFGDGKNPSSWIEPTIPMITWKEALELAKSGLDPNLTTINHAAEAYIGKVIKEKHNCDFVYITNYPIEERPFYAYPNEDGTTDTFDLIYKGIEITSGGRRISDYNQLVQSIRARGLNPDNMESYLMPFKYGMPPHGGFGMGLERFMKIMLNLDTVDEASLIPRTAERTQH